LGEIAPEGRIVSIDVWLRVEHDSTVSSGPAGRNRAAWRAGVGFSRVWRPG
jgi:hypothetical protein